MIDGVVTQAEVMRWLPADIRESLQASTPCFGGGAHDWQHRSIDLRRMDSAFTRTEEWWSCTRPGCELTVKTDPRRPAA